jgi:two-component system CheB/CheR fusion protein
MPTDRDPVDQETQMTSRRVPATATIPPVDGAGMRVLLVEDHVDSALSVARLLRALGYDVRVAFDGIEALRCAAEFRPEAAFIDLSLPQIDGFAVATRLRAMPETRDARLIAMTGWATEECAVLARDAGFDLHLVKPLSIGTLTAALATARC